MVFRRRERRGILRTLGEVFYPKGGWSRAFSYVQKRLQRLPGSPESIGRGIWVGIFASFTPIFGFHIIFAAIAAFLIRGNVIAAVLATFFGNPLTFVPISVGAMQTGTFLLGLPRWREREETILDLFYQAGGDLYRNFMAMFTKDVADWSHLQEFWSSIFLPYLVGGLILGTIVATISYVIAVPLIRVFQNRRKGRIAAKFEEQRAKASMLLRSKNGNSNDDEPRD